jgi:hypothetical protein
MRATRTVETTETRSALSVVFDSGETWSGQCTIRHLRQLILAEGQWVFGSHDVELICDDDLPYGTHGRPGRAIVTEGYTLVGTDNWKVYPANRRLLAYGGD